MKKMNRYVKFGIEVTTIPIGFALAAANLGFGAAEFAQITVEKMVNGSQAAYNMALRDYNNLSQGEAACVVPLPTMAARHYVRTHGE